mgnify:CR=1 FL=1
MTRHDHNAHSDLPIDAMAPDAALSAMLRSQVRALDSVAPALPKIAEAAALMAQVLGQGGVVHLLLQQCVHSFCCMHDPRSV